MNIKKTKYVTFGLKSQVKKIINHRLYINDRVLDKVSSYKYLGITLDAYLTCNRHVENCINVASHKVFLLAKIRKYITFKAAVRIYKTVILPILDYENILYDGCNQNLLSKVQTLQSRGLRLCNYQPYHVPTLYQHESTGMARLDLRRKMHLLLFMFKQKANMSIVNT